MVHLDEAGGDRISCNRLIVRQGPPHRKSPKHLDMNPEMETTLGRLYRADCLDVLPTLPGGSVDAVFADPPFNLHKDYGPHVSDNRSDQGYLGWCSEWIRECARLIRPGGSFFIYNLPRWNITLGGVLQSCGLSFRHWIAIEHTGRLPIQGRLYPSHYSLLYYTLGQPRVFRRIRTPIQTCRHCGKELKDYGGHRAAMNPDGVTLKDVWTDIPPVRHGKYKPMARNANALSTKVVERAIEMSTLPGDTVLDPFGGSGTTYAVCEQRGRRWIGVEIEDLTPILQRLNGDVHNHANGDFGLS